MFSKGAGAYHTGMGANNVRQNNDKKPSVSANDSNSNEFYPHKDFLLFEQSNPDLIIKKLKELHQQIDISNQNEIIADKNNIELIENLLSNCNDSNDIGQSSDQIDLLFQMIELWPSGKLKILKV